MATNHTRVCRSFAADGMKSPESRQELSVRGAKGSLEVRVLGALGPTINTKGFNRNHSPMPRRDGPRRAEHQA